MLDRGQVRHGLLEQPEARRDLRGAHIPLALYMLNEGVEDIAVLDFNPVLVRHGEAGLSAALRAHEKCFRLISSMRSFNRFSERQTVSKLIMYSYAANAATMTSTNKSHWLGIFPLPLFDRARHRVLAVQRRIFHEDGRMRRYRSLLVLSRD